MRFTNSVPLRPTWIWTVGAFIVLVGPWLPSWAGQRAGGLVGTMLTSAVGAVVLVAELRRLMYWRHHQDYAKTAVELAGLVAAAPVGEPLHTSDGHQLWCWQAKHRTWSGYAIVRHDDAALREVENELMDGTELPLLPVDVYTLRDGEYRVTHSKWMRRVWPNGDLETIGAEVFSSWTWWRLSRTGLLDVSAGELQQLVQELRSSTPA